MSQVQLREFTLEGMVRAVQKVRDRMLRATAALERAAVPYAVIGGNAVAAWISRVDESAARNTQDVDLLVRAGRVDVIVTGGASPRLVGPDKVQSACFRSEG